MHNRAKALAISLPVKVSSMSLPLKAAADDDTAVWEDWPCILPHDMASHQ